MRRKKNEGERSEVITCKEKKKENQTYLIFYDFFPDFLEKKHILT